MCCSDTAMLGHGCITAGRFERPFAPRGAAKNAAPVDNRWIACAPVRAINLDRCVIVTRAKRDLSEPWSHMHLIWLMNRYT
jgi:hypothetical protein